MPRITLPSRIKSALPKDKSTGTRIIFTSSLIILLVGVAFFLGFFSRDILSGRINPFPLVQEALRILEEKGIKSLPEPQTIQYAMINGLLKAYDDPYSVFIEPPQAELQSNQLEGKFGGIGVRLERDSGGNVLLYPLPGSTALIAGLKDGDLLLGVNKLNVTPQTLIDTIQAEIRGPIGETVDINVAREPEFSNKQFTVTRTEVPIPSVTYNLASFDPTIGIIQLALIAETSPDEIVKAVEQLRIAGATRFILDLRNNGGGLVDAGADVVRLFLSKGIFLEEQFKNENVISFSADDNGPLSEVPLAIVVNHNTASAAEIIAGALQCSGRAQLIGTQTFGKDSVQKVFQLKDGSSLHVTAGRWWLPISENVSVQKGLIPDKILTDAETDSAVVLEEAGKILDQPR